MSPEPPRGYERVQEIALLGGLGVLLSALMVLYSPWAYSLVVTLKVVLCLLGIGTAAVLVLVKQGHAPTLTRPQVVMIGLFAVSAGVSIAAAPSHLGALPRSVLYLALISLVVSVYLLHRDRGRVPLAGYLTVIAAVHIPFMLYAMADVWSWHGEFQTAIGVFANPRHFGSAGALSAMAAVSLTVLSRSPRVSFALAVPALFGVVASGSRAALLAWMIFVGCLALWKRHRRELVLVSMSAVGIAVTAVLALDRSGLLPSPNLFRRLDAAVSGQTDDLSSGRWEVWSCAGQQVAAHPWFGRGPEAYWMSGNCLTSHPHNAILNTLIEFGVVGCALLLLLIGAAIARGGGPRWFVRTAVSTPAARVLTAILVAYFALSMVSGSAHWVLTLVIVAVLYGLWLTVLHHDKAEPEARLALGESAPASLRLHASGAGRADAVNDVPGR